MLSIAIQAGGESQRMGMEKGKIPFLGVPMIQRIIDSLSSLTDDIIIITNQPELYRFTGLPLFEDVTPGKGPLGGLLTALTTAKQPLAAVIACDMPFVNPQLLKYQAEIIQSEGVDCVIPLIDNRYEPLHAVYRREICLPAVKYALETDHWRMISWLPMVQVHTISQEECTFFDPHKLAFINVNTPDELSAAEKIARELSQPG